MTLSLCMIVKNEEEVLSRCLDSCKKLFEEIIIVDTGSEDKTKEIAYQYTDKVFDFNWCDDFGKARNFSFSKATSDYIMWLDADDIILEDDVNQLLELKKELKEDVIMLKYNIAFDEFGNPTFSYYRERILKREKNYQWCDKVHEYIKIFGNIIKKEIAITHKKIPKLSDRNLNIYKKMEQELVEFTPRNLYYYGRELCDHQEYEKASKILNRFLATNLGWVEDNINACILLSQCENKIDHLFQTFKYDIPRSKACFLIGNYFLDQKEYEKAIFWYELIFTLDNNQTLGFFEKEYTDFFPYLNLSTCYYYLGDQKKAKYYFTLAEEIKPNDSTVINNKKYFID